MHLFNNFTIVALIKTWYNQVWNNPRTLYIFSTIYGLSYVVILFLGDSISLTTHNLTLSLLNAFSTAFFFDCVSRGRPLPLDNIRFLLLIGIMAPFFTMTIFNMFYCSTVAYKYICGSLSVLPFGPITFIFFGLFTIGITLYRIITGTSIKFTKFNTTRKYFGLGLVLIPIIPSIHYFDPSVTFIGFAFTLDNFTMLSTNGTSSGTVDSSLEGSFSQVANTTNNNSNQGDNPQVEDIGSIPSFNPNHQNTGNLAVDAATNTAAGALMGAAAGASLGTAVSGLGVVGADAIGALTGAIGGATWEFMTTVAERGAEIESRRDRSVSPEAGEFSGQYGVGHGENKRWV